MTPHNFHARLIRGLADQTDIAEDRIAAMVDAMRELSRAASLMQRVARDDASHLRAHDTAAAQLCQLDATWRLAKVIPAAHPVWHVVRACQLEMAEYIVDELAFVRGYRDARALDRRAAIDLALAKHGLARACPHLLGALDDRFEPRRFEAPIRHICLAVQALDDARRWRSDVSRGRPSLVLTGVPLEFDLAAPEDVRALQRWVITSGHLRGVIDLAAEQLALAQRGMEDAPSSRLVPMLDALQARIASVRELLPARSATP